MSDPTNTSTVNWSRFVFLDPADPNLVSLEFAGALTEDEDGFNVTMMDDEGKELKSRFINKSEALQLANWIIEWYKED